MLSTAFLIAALVLFVLAAIKVEASKVNFVAAGLACTAASMLLPRVM